MTDWISCEESMPPKGMLVEVKRPHGEIRKASYKGIFQKRWVYPSGLAKFVSEDDYWRPILDKKPEKKDE